MNFSAVRIIRRGRRNGESGQAFAELTISLIAIIAAFAGFLLIAVLSADGVSISIRARESADRLSSRGGSSRAGVSISHWDYGPDTVPFTADDNPVGGAGGNGPLFRAQLKDFSGKVSFVGSSPLRYDDEFGRLQDEDFFVSAADLAKGDPNPPKDALRRHGIGELENVVRGLFGVNDAEVRDTVYMPAHKDIPELR